MCIRDRAQTDQETNPAATGEELAVEESGSRATTVSYTHLDVYKRQGERTGAPAERRAPANAPWGSSSEATLAWGKLAKRRFSGVN